VSAESSRPSGADESLVNDPEFPWAGGCPYDVINARLKADNEPLIGPRSTTSQVSDAGFTLSTAEKKAWEQLRKPERRVGVDFLHYPLPDLQLDEVDPSSLEQPMPVVMPDLLSLADCRVELGAVVEAPPQFDLHEVSLFGLIDFGLAELLPSPLCEDGPLLSDLIEVDDDEQ
jgi:hypothetical protein